MSNQRIISLITGLLFAIVSGTGARIYSQTPAVSSSQHSIDTATSTEYFRVVRVVDGDTLIVHMNKKDVKVRLIGLDTPEIVDPRRPVQCYAKAASDEAHRILDNRSVWLETDPSQGEYDKYHRLLAYLFLPATATSSGILFNQYMIENGFGHEYTYRLPYKYQSRFKNAERNAREAGRGLWAPGVCGL